MDDNNLLLENNEIEKTNDDLNIIHINYHITKDNLLEIYNTIKLLISHILIIIYKNKTIYRNKIYCFLRLKSKIDDYNHILNDFCIL